MPSGLEVAMRELDVHVAEGGWDQPTRLFAIADTEALLAREPQLSVELSATHSLWTTIEQQEIPPHDDLDDLLGGIRWPAAVEGVALSAERIMVDEESAGDLPADPVATRRTVAEHPLRHEMRITIGVLRDGDRCTVLRLREHDHADSVIVGEDLIDGLGQLLLNTLQ
jgi:hypothetical protein